MSGATGGVFPPHPADRVAAVADRRQAVQQRARILAEQQQRLIDAEVRRTRRDLLRAMRRRGGDNAVAFCAPDFLAVADQPTIYRAIVDAAVTVGDATCADLQMYDVQAGVLRIADHHGLRPAFLAYFATVGAGQRTACATAMATGMPVMVDDVIRSPIFAGQPTLEPMLDTECRAVYSYPLIAHGEVVGVLSLHHRKPLPHHGSTELIAHSAALALLSTRAGVTRAGKADPGPRG